MDASRRWMVAVGEDEAAAPASIQKLPAERGQQADA